jgi:hypothetical protein
MRLSPQTGKEDCRIIDFVDNHSRVGGVVSVPTIFGLDPNEFDLEGTSRPYFQLLRSVNFFLQMRRFHPLKIV